MRGSLTVLICGLLGCAMFTRAEAAETGNLRDLSTSAIEFGIERNGDSVGTHVVKFMDTPLGLQVVSATRIEIPFLWLTAYDFRYKSIALWDEAGLLTLDVDADDDGDIFSMTVNTSGEEYTVETLRNKFSVGRPLFPTNHWHAGVLAQSQVLNTLTGKINAVTVREIEREPVETERGSIEATRYQYSGDLEISVWYDDQRRWVRMQFEGRDGSSITYVCRRCQGDNLDLGLS